MPPIAPSAWRSAIETFTVTVFCSTVVSAASRLVSSPVRRWSKNAMSWSRMAEKRRVRRSATMRSPATVKSQARSMAKIACTANSTTSSTVPVSNVDRRRARHQRVDHVADRLRVEQADARAHQQRDGGDREARELRPRQRDDAAELYSGAGPALAVRRGGGLGSVRGRSSTRIQVSC